MKTNQLSPPKVQEIKQICFSRPYQLPYPSCRIWGPVMRFSHSFSRIWGPVMRFFPFIHFPFHSQENEVMWQNQILRCKLVSKPIYKFSHSREENGIDGLQTTLELDQLRTDIIMSRYKILHKYISSKQQNEPDNIKTINNFFSFLTIGQYIFSCLCCR